MNSGRATDRAGYAQLIEQLARQALAVAADAAPHRARQGEKRWPMADALPAARVLVGADQASDRQALAGAAQSLRDAIADPNGKVADGFGHHRPVYALLAIHLLSTASKLASDAQALDTARQAAEALMLHPDAADTDPRLGVWRRLVARQHGITHAEPMPLAADLPAPLAPLGLDDLIDAWTYRELVGLHALHLCALVEKNDALQAQVRSAAEYHLGHTQPDYTTYQPWALAAFADDPHTAVFAEQQLHDVATHLSIEGPGSAVLPALLLSDASAAMSGKTAQAWYR